MSEKQAFLVEDLHDLFYLTGNHVSLGSLLITKKGAFFAVDSRYYDAVKNKTPCQVLLSERGGAGAFDAFAKVLKDSGEIGFDPSETLCSRATLLKSAFKKNRLIEMASPVKQERLVKDAKEQQALRKAALLNQEGMDFAINLLEEGITEKALALELEIFWKRKGGGALSFEPIIAFGANSASAHHRPSSKALKKGDVVLLDMGISLESYQSDMTRTVFFGECSPFWKKAFEAVLGAQKKALDAVKPGVACEDLDKKARSYLEKTGFGEYFTHSLGHGVGLEIHEAPWLRKARGKEKTYLEDGMCVTIEPGVYFPEKGGIRIEDTVLVTEKGCENLYPRKKELTVIHR